MILCDCAVVLARKDFREADRAVSVYTKNHGRLNLRFPGVNRPKGKLKAFSEPFVWADYRIYLRSPSALGCAAGGKIFSVFPAIRADLKKTRLALHFCELMFRMTPDSQPNEGKYNLLVEALNRLEVSPPSDGLRAAYALRLMQLAGLGLAGRPVLGASREFWEKIHEAPLSEVEPDGTNVEKAGRVVNRFIAGYFDKPLKTADVI